MTTIKFTDYFYGEEITEQEKGAGYVSYATLYKGIGGGVMCNDITKLFYADINGEYNEPELYNGTDYNEETGEYIDIYQYYIIDGNAAEILKRHTDETVYYIPLLDVYVWGICHYGTAWVAVSTDIEINKEYTI